MAEFLVNVEAALMGRTTFDPALTNDRWPWPGSRVFVLGSHRPQGTPEDVTVEGDPVRLLEQVRAPNGGGDVPLIGGPRTIEIFRTLGALDKLELVVLPFLVGGGMRLSDALSVDTGLEFESTRALPGGSVEIVYRVRSGGSNSALHEVDWAPARQRRCGDRASSFRPGEAGSRRRIPLIGASVALGAVRRALTESSRGRCGRRKPEWDYR